MVSIMYSWRKSKQDTCGSPKREKKGIGKKYVTIFRIFYDANRFDYN